MLRIRGHKVRKWVVESLAMLEGPKGLTVKQVAVLEGVTPDAIRKRRRRLERKLGDLMPRHEKRGRKPMQIAA